MEWTINTTVKTTPVETCQWLLDRSGWTLVGEEDLADHSDRIALDYRGILRAVITTFRRKGTATMLGEFLGKPLTISIMLETKENPKRLLKIVYQLAFDFAAAINGDIELQENYDVVVRIKGGQTSIAPSKFSGTALVDLLPEEFQELKDFH